MEASLSILSAPFWLRHQLDNIHWGWSQRMSNSEPLCNIYDSCCLNPKLAELCHCNSLARCLQPGEFSHCSDQLARAYWPAQLSGPISPRLSILPFPLSSSAHGDMCFFRRPTRPSGPRQHSARARHRSCQWHRSPRARRGQRSPAFSWLQLGSSPRARQAAAAGTPIGRRSRAAAVDPRRFTGT